MSEQLAEATDHEAFFDSTVGMVTFRQSLLPRAFVLISTTSDKTQYYLGIQVDDERGPLITSLGTFTHDDRRVRAVHFRDAERWYFGQKAESEWLAIAVRQITAQLAEASLSGTVAGDWSPGPIFRAVDKIVTPQVHAITSRRRMTDKHLSRVADVYRRALGEGFPPTQEVESTFEVSHSTAARWVSVARERGFLGSTTPGKAGELQAELGLNDGSES